MNNLIKLNIALTVYLVFTLFVPLTVMLYLTAVSDLSASEGAAKIFFTEETHDFGNVEQGTHLEYSFKFTNEGDKPLVIEKVQPSCGCTGATVGEKTQYAEDECGEIKITFNTQGREGHQEKNITVLTNDPDNLQKVLKFSCDINSESN